MENLRKIDIRDLALYYIYYFLSKSTKISHLRLQRLLYYTQAYYLVYFDKELIFEDIPEAWANGPVYRNIYDEFNDIDSYYDNIDNNFSYYLTVLSSILNSEQMDFIGSICFNFGKMDDTKLSMLTYLEDPWCIARIGCGPFGYNKETVSFDDMYSYYSKILSKS